MFWNWFVQPMLCDFFCLAHHQWIPPAISMWTRCWCFWLSRQLMVSTLPGNFSNLPAMLLYMTLTRPSFHNLVSPTSSTTERETSVHEVILSVCWCAQLPLRFAAFVRSFSWEKNKSILSIQFQVWILVADIWFIPSCNHCFGFIVRLTSKFCWLIKPLSAQLLPI